jgi:hypothetical protein
MKMTASRLRTLQRDRTSLVSLKQAAVFLQVRVHQLEHLCNRGVLPVARRADGERFSISDKRLTIEVAKLREALDPTETRAFDRWLSGEYDTPEAAVASVTGTETIAHGERRRERSGSLGAL